MLFNQAVTREPRINLLQKEGNDTYKEFLARDDKYQVSCLPLVLLPAWVLREEHGFCGSWKEDKEKKGDTAPQESKYSVRCLTLSV